MKKDWNFSRKPDQHYLKQCLLELKHYLGSELHLELNEKTQIFPLRNGVDYLGFHFYLSEKGKVIRKVRRRTKQRYRRKLKYYQHAYKKGRCTFQEVSQTINAYQAHLSHGDTWYLRKKLLSGFVLTRNTTET